MNKVIFPILSAILLFPVNSFGALSSGSCIPTTSCPLPQDRECKMMTEIGGLHGTSETLYYGGTGVVNYTSCVEGYILATKTVNISGCGLVSYHVCERTSIPTEPCEPCTNCTSDITWQNTLRDGYQEKTTAVCSCGRCTKTVNYRCAANYYGRSFNGTSGCTSCSESTGTPAARSAAGSTSITDCYLPIGTEVKDESGTYTFRGMCNYTMPSVEFN